MEILLNALAIFLASYMLEGIEIKNFLHAIFAAIVLALVNFFIKPVVSLLFLPVNFITLGLFSLVINAAMLILVSKIVTGLKIRSFGTAVFFGVLLSIFNTLLRWIF